MNDIWEFLNKSKNKKEKEKKKEKEINKSWYIYFADNRQKLLILDALGIDSNKKYEVLTLSQLCNYVFYYQFQNITFEANMIIVHNMVYVHYC